MSMEQGNNTTILKELSDIKSSLAVNTSETSNIKATIGEIKSDVRDIKINSVTQEQHNEVLKIITDHEARLRTIETAITKLMTWGAAALIAMGILEFIISKYF